MAWLINTLFTLLFGAVVVPLVAFAAGPLAGYASVAVVLGGYFVAKCSVPAEDWRREYAWSFLAPAAGFFLSQRLRRRGEVEAARVSWRLVLLGAAFLYALASVAHVAIRRQGEANLRRDLADPARTVMILRKYHAGRPLESLQGTAGYREQTPERRAAVDAAWRAVQRDYYRAEIRKRAPGKTLDETRWALRFDRLAPSQHAALDAAWRRLQDGS